MPTKPQTYAQQVQDLKGQNLELHKTIESLNEQLAALPELQEELSVLKGQIVNQSNSSTDRVENIQLNDAKQMVEQSAQQIKVLQQQKTELFNENAALQQRLAEYAVVDQTVANYQFKVDSLGIQLQEAAEQITRTKQQAQDAINQASQQANAASNELRTLRMTQQGFENRIAQLQESTNTLASQSNSMVQAYKEENERLRDKLATAQVAIYGYRKVVNSLPDTKAQLLAILNTVPDAESTE